MSVTSSLRWYSQNSMLNERKILGGLSAAVGFDYVTLVSCAKPIREEGSAPEWCNVAEEVDLTSQPLESFYMPDSFLQIDEDESQLVARLENYQKSIPESVRGNFIFDRLSIQIGRGYFKSKDEFVRFSLCFIFWGHSTPTDCAEFRRWLESNEDVRREKLELERLCGRLEQSISFG